MLDRLRELVEECPLDECGECAYCHKTSPFWVKGTRHWPDCPWAKARQFVNEIDGIQTENLFPDPVDDLIDHMARNWDSANNIFCSDKDR